MASTIDPFSDPLLNDVTVEDGQKFPSSLKEALLTPSNDPLSAIVNLDSDLARTIKSNPELSTGSTQQLSLDASSAPVEPNESSESKSTTSIPEKLSKIRPIPLHLTKSSFQVLSDLPKVPSSPRFNIRMSKGSGTSRKIKSPKSQIVSSTSRLRGKNANPIPREKRKRMIEELQSDLQASVSSKVEKFQDDKSRSLPEIRSTSPSKQHHEHGGNHVPKDITKEQSPPHSLTLWRYLLLELASQKNEVFTEEKTEHLLNFAEVPFYLEQVIIFGTLTCLDSFLHFFTILPLRFIYALYKLCNNFLNGVKTRLPMSRKADIIKGLIFVLVLNLLLQLDTSKIYHSIRGQAALKLYFMFNVLEIADKLFSALGQDILECLFSYETLNRNYKDTVTRFYRPVIFAILGIIYVYFHSLVILYQLITLNVAVNSYSNALLTLLLSNQFSEIKSAVFKKFERENLFQLTCADITERFQLTAMLFIIGTRNIVEVSNAGLVPRSWSGWNRWLGALIGPMIVVVGSEVCVDWLKHAYIAKFNNIRPKVYRKFLDVLAYDYSENSFSDDIMIKRVGIPIFPIASVFFRMLLQSYAMLADHKGPKMSIFEASPTPTTVLSSKISNVTTMTSAVTIFEAPRSSSFPLNLLDDFIQNGKSAITFFTPSFTINPDAFYSYLSFILVFLTGFILLFALKLILGLFLLQYSSNRRAQLMGRSQTTYSMLPHSTRGSISQPSRSRAQSQSLARTTAKSTQSQANNLAAQSGYESDESDHVPGLLKGGKGLVEIPKHLREKLYLPEEPVPPLKGRKSNVKEFRDLLSIERFKMAAKQIW